MLQSLVHLYQIVYQHFYHLTFSLIITIYQDVYGNANAHSKGWDSQDLLSFACNMFQLNS